MPTEDWLRRDEKPCSFWFLVSQSPLRLSVLPSYGVRDKANACEVKRRLRLEANRSLAWGKADGGEHNSQHPSHLHRGPSYQLSFELEQTQISFPSALVTVAGRTFCRMQRLKCHYVPQPGCLSKHAFFPSSLAPGHMAVHPASMWLAGFSCARSFMEIFRTEEPFQQIDCAESTQRETCTFFFILQPTPVVKIISVYVHSASWCSNLWPSSLISC